MTDYIPPLEEQAVNGEHGIILRAIHRLEANLSAVRTELFRTREDVATIQARCVEREKVNDAREARIARISEEVNALGGEVDTGRIDLTKLEAQQQAREAAIAQAKAEREAELAREQQRKNHRLAAIVAIICAIIGALSGVIAGGCIL